VISCSGVIVVSLVHVNFIREREMLLTGLKVLDLADQKAAICSKLLADMGAHVIKVEPPGGDPSRMSGPFVDHRPDTEKSLSFFYNNCGKSGITLNIEHKEGKALFLELVKKNDVIVESFSPGHLDRLGLGFEKIQRLNPRIIMASVTGFGRTGPLKDHKTCDLVASAFGGQMFATGSCKPLKIYGEQSSLTASLFAAIGILLALRNLRITGVGEHLDISIQEAVASTLDHILVQYFYQKIIVKRQGSLHWDRLFHIFPCKDGFIQMTISDKWQTLVEWMDSEGMAGDLVNPDYRDDIHRRRRLDHILELIGNWTKTHTVNDLFHKGQNMQFPWGPIDSPRQVVESPQLKARGFFKDINPSRNDIAMKCPGVPYRLVPDHSSPQAKAPSIGEDNINLYVKEMGLSSEKIIELSSLGII
jgi:benzylsuccinate CoA-transferase BbsE subunit